MSLDLYPNRIYFINGRGSAKAHGVTVPLARPPVELGADVVEVDYAPAVVALLRQEFFCWREMSTSEIKAASIFLDGLRG